MEFITLTCTIRTAVNRVAEQLVGIFASLCGILGAIVRIAGSRKLEHVAVASERSRHTIQFIGIADGRAF